MQESLTQLPKTKEKEIENRLHTKVCKEKRNRKLDNNSHLKRVIIVEPVLRARNQESNKHHSRNDPASHKMIASLNQNCN
jgi:hypothetical protein